MPSYPQWRPGDTMNDQLIILEDTDRDGKADRMKVFADGLHLPIGFEFFNGGVLVSGSATCFSSRTPMATTRPTRAR
jgi:hypothetical protein